MTIFLYDHLVSGVYGVTSTFGAVIRFLLGIGGCCLSLLLSIFPVRSTFGSHLCASGLVVGLSFLGLVSFYGITALYTYVFLFIIAGLSVGRFFLPLRSDFYEYYD